MKKQYIGKIAGLMAATAISIGASTSAHGAWEFTTSGTDAGGDNISATATFVDLGGGKLQITLVNTSTDPSARVTGVLYSLYFSGAVITSIDTQKAPSGSKIWDLSDGPGTFSTAGGSGYNTSWSIKDSPLGLTALGPPSPITDPSGAQGDGILSGTFNGGTFGNGGLGNAQHNPYVQNSIVFTLNYSSLGDIGNVQFNWGTTADNTTPGSPVVPEPSTIVAGLLLLLPFGASAVRILRKNRAA